jgi:flagellar motility protein MotE (MotC chaperone)
LAVVFFGGFMSVFLVLDDNSIRVLQAKLLEFGLPELASGNGKEGERGLFMPEEFVAAALDFVGLMAVEVTKLSGYKNMMRITTAKRPENIPSGIELLGWRSVENSNVGTLLAEMLVSLSEFSISRLTIACGLYLSPVEEIEQESFLVLFGQREGASGSDLLVFEYQEESPSVMVESERCLRILTVPSVLTEAEVLEMKRCVNQFLSGLAEHGSVDYFAKLTQQMQDRATDTLLSKLWSGLEGDIAHMKSQLQTKRGEYDTALQRLADCRQAVVKAEALLQAQCRALEDQRAAAAAELRAVKEIPKVKDLFVSKGVISVYTDHLVALDSRSGKYHAIGMFRIDFYPNEKGGDTVRWHNLNRVISAGDKIYAAPHVSSDGKPCLGKFANSLPSAVREYRLHAAVTLAISLVERVDVEDGWGKYVYRWPLAEVDMIDGIAYFRGLVP